MLVLVLVRLLLRFLPPRLAAGPSAQLRLAALGGAAAAARRVGDGPQQLHHRASLAPSCPALPCGAPTPFPAPLRTPSGAPGPPLYSGRRLRPGAAGWPPPVPRSARLARPGPRAARGELGRSGVTDAGRRCGGARGMR